MKIIALNKAEKNEVHMDGAVGAWKQLPLGNDDGTPVYSYRVFTVESGGHTPYHQHPYEHMNYVIEGTGALVNEKGEEQPLTCHPRRKTPVPQQGRCALQNDLRGAEGV
jgi:quercetin dioxygenase-like cupin family protein